MPKSSIAIRTPMRERAQRRRARAGLVISALSVISSSRWRGGEPGGLGRPRATCVVEVWAARAGAADTLTATRIGRRAALVASARACGRPRASTQLADRHDRPVSSASGMNSAGREPALGVLPAQRAPRRRRAAVSQLDDRLVVSTNSSRSSAAQVGLELAAAQRVAAIAVVEDSVACRGRAPWPGTSRRRRCAAASSARRRRAGSAMPMLAVHEDLASGEVERLARAPRASARRSRARRARRRGLDEHARTRRRRGGPPCRSGARPRAAARPTARAARRRRVAQGVVDRLEVVEVEQQHRRRRGAARGAQRLFHAVDAGQLAVREVGSAGRAATGGA